MQDAEYKHRHSYESDNDETQKEGKNKKTTECISLSLIVYHTYCLLADIESFSPPPGLLTWGNYPSPGTRNLIPTNGTVRKFVANNSTQLSLSHVRSQAFCFSPPEHHPTSMLPHSHRTEANESTRSIIILPPIVLYIICSVESS